MNVLKLSFNDPDQKNIAQKKIASLKQVNQVFLEYLADFQRWIGDMGYNKANQRFYFQNGLSRELQGYLVTIDIENLAFDELINKCQLLDAYYYQIKPVSTTARTTTTTTTAYAGGMPVVHTSNIDSNTAMDLSAMNSRPYASPRGPLTTKERQHRIKKSLCLYYDKPDHLARDCEKKKRAQATRDTYISSAILTTTPQASSTL